MSSLHGLFLDHATHFLKTWVGVTMEEARYLLEKVSRASHHHVKREKEQDTQTTF